MNLKKDIITNKETKEGFTDNLGGGGGVVEERKGGEEARYIEG
jgi:hypothetical protein